MERFYLGIALRHIITWSRKQLKEATMKIIALYDKVAIREQTAEHLSQKAAEALIQSEFRHAADIRMHIHTIRLGESYAQSFRQKLEDEDARADFQLVSGNSKAFKLFSKELSASQKSSGSRGIRKGSGTARSSSTPRTTYRRRGGRGRRRRPARSSFRNRSFRSYPRHRSPRRNSRGNRNRPRSASRSRTTGGTA